MRDIMCILIYSFIHLCPSLRAILTSAKLIILLQLQCIRNSSTTQCTNINQTTKWWEFILECVPLSTVQLQAHSSAFNIYRYSKHNMIWLIPWRKWISHWIYCMMPFSVFRLLWYFIFVNLSSIKVILLKIPLQYLQSTLNMYQAANKIAAGFLELTLMPPLIFCL